MDLASILPWLSKAPPETGEATKQVGGGIHVTRHGSRDSSPSGFRNTKKTEGVNWFDQPAAQSLRDSVSRLVQDLNLSPRDSRSERHSYNSHQLSHDRWDASSDDDDIHGLDPRDALSFVSNGTRKFNAPEVCFSKRGQSPSPGPRSARTADYSGRGEVRTRSASPASVSENTGGVLARMYLALKEEHAVVLEQYDSALAQNEAMRNSIIALESAMANVRSELKSSSDSIAVQQLRLQNIKLREEVQARSRELQDLYLSRKLGLLEGPSAGSLHSANAALMQQLRDLSQQRELMQQEVSTLKLQLLQERRRREHSEDELRASRAPPDCAGSANPTPSSTGAAALYKDGLVSEFLHSYALRHGSNPTAAMGFDTFTGQTPVKPASSGSLSARSVTDVRHFESSAHLTVGGSPAGSYGSVYSRFSANGSSR